jgi:glyoxylase-like metal-dependent hydrolase (beta-lactamase superfamily II)
VNAGFVAGDEVTLIVDTGGNAYAAGTIYGYASAVRLGNEVRVINTEKHFDHIGGNGYFREQGLEVWGHVGIARTAAEFEGEMAEFNASIPSGARRARGEAGAFFHGTRLTNPNRAIEQDTKMELGGCTAEILLTPGHTPTNLSVWIPEDGVLYTGDCLISEYLPNLDAGTPADWRVWLESLGRVEALGAKTVVAGHGPVVSGGQVGTMIATVRRVLEEAIARGYSPTAESERAG